jgi:hypothetical protein
VDCLHRTTAKTVRIKIVLATGLALVALAVLLVLAHSPATVVASNGVASATVLGTTTGDARACQAGEALPAHTSAIRLQIEATTGPRVAVAVFAGTNLITRGTQGTGWYGSVVTVPVAPVGRAFAHTTVCFGLSDLTGLVALSGASTSPAIAATAGGKPLSGRLRIEYLRPSGKSWWSRAGSVIAHMGLGRAASGSWIVLPILLLGAGAIALASWTLVRELR